MPPTEYEIKALFSSGDPFYVSCKVSYKSLLNMKNTDCHETLQEMVGRQHKKIRALYMVLTHLVQLRGVYRVESPCFQGVVVENGETVVPI